MKISSISQERIGLPERSLGRHYRKRATDKKAMPGRFKKFYPLMEALITILIVIFVLGLWKISGMYDWWIQFVGKII